MSLNWHIVLISKPEAALRTFKITWLPISFDSRLSIEDVIKSKLVYSVRMNSKIWPKHVSVLNKRHVKTPCFITQLAANFAAKSILILMTSISVAKDLAHSILIIWFDQTLTWRAMLRRTYIYIYISTRVVFIAWVGLLGSAQFRQLSFLRRRQKSQLIYSNTFSFPHIVFFFNHLTSDR